jgi:hypothetical protein
LRWDDQLAVLCAKANKEFMRTVQQNVFLILNRVPVTIVLLEFMWCQIVKLSSAPDDTIE